MVSFGGYTIPTFEVILFVAVGAILIYFLVIRQFKGVPIHAIMFFKGETTGFYFAKNVTENLDLHKLYIKVNKATTLEFDTTKGAPLEMRISSYRWVRLYFCSEATNQTCSYKHMIEEAVKTQNLSGETALRLMTRSKQYIETIMTQSKDNIAAHMPYLMAGGGLGIALGMIIMMLFR